MTWKDWPKLMADKRKGPTMNSTEQEHTPLPWVAGIAPEEATPTYLIGARGDFFARVVDGPGNPGEANARYIVKAANGYQDMREALLQIARTVQRRRKMTAHMQRKVRDIAREALAKADQCT